MRINLRDTIADRPLDIPVETPMNDDNLPALQFSPPPRPSILDRILNQFESRPPQMGLNKFHTYENG